LQKIYKDKKKGNKYILTLEKKNFFKFTGLYNLKRMNLNEKSGNISLMLFHHAIP